MPFDLTYIFPSGEKRSIRRTLGALRRCLPPEHREADLSEVALTDGTPTEDERFLFDTYTRIVFEEGSAESNAALREAVCLVEAMFAEKLRAALEERRRKQPLRPEVAAFARDMQRKLDANEHKGGWARYDSSGRRVWRRDTVVYLLNRLHEEVDELEEEIFGSFGGTFNEIISEAADVGNFAMMIADTYRTSPPVLRAGGADGEAKG